VLIIDKNHPNPLLIAIVLAAWINLSLPGWAKTPISVDSGINKFEKDLQQLSNDSDKEAKGSEALPYDRQAEENIKSGKYEEAVETCSKAIAINPEDLHAYRLRAVAYMQLGKEDKAKEDQAKLIELQAQISERNSRSEITKYTAAIKANPKNAKAYADRAAAYMSLNKYDEAIADSSKSISLDPTNKYPYFTRMAAYTALHENVKAQADRQTFQKLDRGDKVRLNTSAVTDYSKILEASPNDVNALLNRARAYIELGQFVAGKKDCDALIKLNADTAEAKEMRNCCQKEIRRHSLKKEKVRK